MKRKTTDYKPECVIFSIYSKDMKLAERSSRDGAISFPTVNAKGIGVVCLMLENHSDLKWKHYATQDIC